MELHNAIARWESEGGAVPQVQRSRKPESAQTRPLTVRRILVPIDFSPESLKALRYAKRLAERFKAKLHMVHVVTPPLVLFPQPRRTLPRLRKKVPAAESQHAPCAILFGSFADRFAYPGFERLR